MKTSKFLEMLCLGALASVAITHMISRANSHNADSHSSQEKGLISLSSKYSSDRTADRFEQILLDKGFTVFSRIDHAEGAARVSEPLEPTEIIIFGNPRIGTKLMQCDRTAAIDLPQKALFWEDEEGKSWLTYNDPQYLANRHLLEGCEDIVLKIEKGLGALAKAATQGD